MSEFRFLAWPTEFRTITQYFGANPQNYAQFGLPGHEGIDIMAPTGSKVFAVAPGTVRMVYNQATGHNYGRHLRLEHAGGFETIYAHLESISVSVGQQVEAGALLGRADNTGNSFGSHLHLTLKRRDTTQGNWPNNIIDPTPYLLPLLGFLRPAGPYTSGWAYADGLTVADDLAQANIGGINLRQTPSINGPLIDLVPSGTIMIINGARQGSYYPVLVPTAALSNAQPPAPPPTPPTPAPGSGVQQVDGWAFASYLTRSGNQGVVGQYGINLRAAPNRTAINMGLLGGGSRVTILGGQQGDYLPVRARLSDFIGPVNIPNVPPIVSPEPAPPASDLLLAWAWTNNLVVDGAAVVAGRYGINLRNKPAVSGVRLGLWREGGRGTVAGKAHGEYTPVRIRRIDVNDLLAVLPPIEQPEPLPGTPPPPPPEPIQDTTPGWAFTSQVITSGGTTAVAGPYGLNLREAPRRDATNKGFIPPNAAMIVTGAAQGEYTPVRVDDLILQPPFGTTPPSPGQPPVINPDPEPLGHARIGLHASADPDISDAEVQEFKDMRPGVIKLLSHHNPEGVGKLVRAFPTDVKWIVRPFLDFGGRQISPQQFFNDTINPTRRTMNLLQGREVVIELHNEPNLRPEGLFTSWADGASFARWWLELFRLYRQAFPGVPIIYPGLSPGTAVSNLKQDHIQFIEASRAAVEAADGLGIHIYWSSVYPMTWSLNVLDDYISRFRYKPIWVTEASNNKAGTPVHVKGNQYIEFWQALQSRPTVQGVTYFVASSINPDFKEEIWVGRGIGSLVGRR